MFSLRHYPGESTTLVVTRTLACDAARAFAAISDPAIMNRWSTAPIAAVRMGDGGLPSGTGAVREVRLPGPGSLRLSEVVLRSEPPHRFEYSVYAGAPIRAHRGVLDLAETPGGTELRWTIALTFPLPGMAAVARRAFERELHRSLDRLVEMASEIDASTPPPRRTLHEESDVDALYAAAEDACAEQRALADELEAAGDPRFWFTRVYQYVTEAQMAACVDHTFQHPAWVLRLVPAFHGYYVRALRSFRANGTCEDAQWQAAFRAMERRKAGDKAFKTMARGVFQGMRAHIEEDLPRALADVFVRNYAGRCDYARMRGDYYQMAPLFGEAGERLLSHVRKGELPLRARLTRALLPKEAEDAMMAKNYYDIPRKRREAFERGERLAMQLLATQQGKGVDA